MHVNERATATMSDGRRLSFDVSGRADGPAVMYFHGAGDSRLARPPGDDLVSEAGVRLISVDRPGYGGSDPAPGRTLMSWADDAAALADTLAIDDFVVLAWSAGGAYALACAAAIPDRVSACALYGSVVPTSMPGYDEGLDDMGRRVKAGAQERPDELREVLRAFASNPVEFALGLVRGEEAGDEVLADEAVLAQMTANAREAFAQGADAMTDDFLLLYGPWQFALDTVRCPVTVASGELDRFSPPAWGQWLADQLPAGRFKAFPGRNHSGFVQAPVFKELLGTLVSTPPR